MQNSNTIYSNMNMIVLRQIFLSCDQVLALLYISLSLSLSLSENTDRDRFCIQHIKNEHIFSILTNQNFCSILFSTYQNLIKTASDNLSRNNTLPFSTWCPLKVHTYLNKPAAFSCRFV